MCRLCRGVRRLLLSGTSSRRDRCSLRVYGGGRFMPRPRFVRLAAPRGRRHYTECLNGRPARGALSLFWGATSTGTTTLLELVANAADSLGSVGRSARGARGAASRRPSAAIQGCDRSWSRRILRVGEVSTPWVGACAENVLGEPSTRSARRQGAAACFSTWSTDTRVVGPATGGPVGGRSVSGTRPRRSSPPRAGRTSSCCSRAAGTRHSGLDAPARRRCGWAHLTSAGGTSNRSDAKPDTACSDG